MTSQPNERSGGRGSYATWRRPATWRNQRLTWFQLALFWSTKSSMGSFTCHVHALSQMPSLLAFRQSPIERFPFHPMGT